MNQERRERIKERAYGFAVAAAIPGCLVVPGLIYFAAKGDTEALKRLGELGGFVMGVWGLQGMGDGDFSMRDALAVRRYRKTIKVSSRVGLREKLHNLPEPPALVETFLKQMYEEWELDALRQYDPNSDKRSVDQERVFVEGFEPSIVSAHLALGATNKLLGFIKKGHGPLYRISGEEKQRQITETDSVVALLRFGWKVKEWHQRGGTVKLDEGQPYSEVAVAGAVLDWVSGTFCINSKKELKNMLSVLAVPTYLRK